MLVAGQRDMQMMDRYTMEKLGLPGIVLMENAGARVVEEILASFSNQTPRVLVLAGGGNNGGDGFVIARRLIDLGVEAQILLLADPTRISGDAKIHYDVYINRKLPIFYLHELSMKEVNPRLEWADVIVDALLGTGVNGPVREPLSRVISLVNEYKGNKLILSVDIPSGVSSDTGNVDGVAIKADKTITFVFPKKGFFFNQGPSYIGEWKAVDISVPPAVAANLGLNLPQLITEDAVKNSIPKRPATGHKGTFGHVLVVGGSRPYVGAPIYSAKAALHSGAGLVTLAVPEGIYPMAAAQCSEALFLPLPEENGHIAARAIVQISSALPQFDCVAVGPGLGRFPGGEKWLKQLLYALTGQALIIDADALYLIRNDLGLLKGYNGQVILTPHPGEMSRLVNKTVSDIEADRLGIAATFAKENNIYLVLKGHRTVIAGPDGEVYINPYGHDALGKGGSGDVLTGLIASFLAQGSSPMNAAISASYLHARAGEEKAKTLSNYGVMPLDIIDGVKELLKESF
ncbi:NAD(P)H-hydrate dehydratase [Neobacillus niacini]|uniref:NAD(P)H-hydrate dehydratase n=1 Tax=Neobacillus niacini TaxID=86668 RepID=UPI0021CAF1E6|nr:NAD(P)H-hydrate dehydratase [Neobacillus niacini]MCM3764872.1 NAD(P)H-hydrate dehydratase [Neobacillus niacini]